MEENRVLLSICIPTYNRAAVLKSVLEKYVSNAEVDESVEIVVSDNASTDETERICREAAKSLPNLKYHRNAENIRDLNFETVISLASGQYIKLINDWMYFDEKALRKVKNRIKEHLIDRTPIFFSNHWLFTKFRDCATIECHSLDEYVSAISSYVTSNNLFGVWKEQWQQVENKGRYSSYKLLQVDWTFQIVSKFNHCIVYNDELISLAPVSLGPRGGYNWFQIHVDNYYRIMQPYINSGKISKKVYKQDRIYLLKHFKYELFQTFIYKINKYWQYETKGTFKILWKYYRYDFFFYCFMIKLPFHTGYIKSSHV